MPGAEAKTKHTSYKSQCHTFFSRFFFHVYSVMVSAYSRCANRAVESRGSPAARDRASCAVPRPQGLPRPIPGTLLPQPLPSLSRGSLPRFSG